MQRKPHFLQCEPLRALRCNTQPTLSFTLCNTELLSIGHNEWKNRTRSTKHRNKMEKHLGYEWTKDTTEKLSYVVNDWLACLVFFLAASTCLTISVLSLQGVEPALLSPSSWTIMVFTDSVSPLLSLDELRGRGRAIQHKHILLWLHLQNNDHPLHW